MSDISVERKTGNVVANAASYYIRENGAALGNKTNVLNHYRSVAYNFTLAAVRKSQLNDPQTFDPKNPDYVVLSTKGKSGGGMSRQVDPIVAKSPTKTVKAGSADNAAYIKAQADAAQVTARNSDYIGQFNQDSPGRFDMFIDDVDIVSVFSFNEGTATALPSEMKFTIIEPYSINGFMEAMQAAAIGAGYTDYVSCSFVMIIDFTGYPATYDIPNPIPIPNATRTYMIKITGVDADITEKGTEYKVTAVLTSGLLFGERIGTLKRTANAKGNTVSEFLKDLADGINEGTKKALASKLGINSYKGLYDQYEIVFPKDGPNGTLLFDVINDIGKSKLNTETKNLSKMQDVGKTKSAYQATSTNSNEKAETKATDEKGNDVHTAQFASGLPIQRIIESAIRDSEYVKRLVDSYMTGKGPPPVDPNDMIDYFIIIPKVRDQEGPVNPDTNSPYKVYTYIVKPYKIIYNMAIPGQGRQVIDSKKLNNLTLRNYNYFYTGLNTDILDFKVNFNTMYYETLPRALGNPPEAVINPDKSNPNNSNVVIQKDQGPRVAEGGLWTAVRSEDSDINSNTPKGQPNAGSGGIEYYHQMVKAMHSTIISSGSGLVTGELSILGDPYYITAGGDGNNASTGGRQGGYAGNQEAAVSSGQVLISINFNNPIDINKNTGLMTFRKENLPFSGIYQINEVRHKFKNGLFTQDLKVSRVPGQPQDTRTLPSPYNEQFTSKPDMYDRTVDDTFKSAGLITTNNGSVQTANNTTNLEGGGYIVANNNTPGGLGGSSNPVFGALNPAGNRGIGLNINNSSGIGLRIIPNGVDQLASGIRASTQGLYDIQNSALGTAAQLNLTARIFGSTSPINPQTVNNIAGLASNLDNRLNQSITNPLLNASSLITSPINNIEANVNNAVFGISNSLNRAFGINASGITGLTGVLSSRLIGSLASSPIPRDVNLSVASANGLLLDKLPILSNIPATTVRQVPFNGGFIGGNPTASSGNTQLANPLSGQNYLLAGVDNTVRSDKLGSSFSLFNNATGQSSSGDGLKLSVNNALQNNSVGLKSSANYLYGSNSDQNTLSPLATALNNSNIKNDGWGEG